MPNRNTFTISVSLMHFKGMVVEILSLI